MTDFSSIEFEIGFVSELMTHTQFVTELVTHTQGHFFGDDTSQFGTKLVDDRCLERKI